jgi:MFS family permease
LSTAAAEPTQRVGRPWITRFTLVWLGVWMAWLVPVQLALPEQFDAIDKAHSYRDFGILNGVAGIVTLVLLPICGALCDRTRTPFGRRRIWVLGGIALYAVALVLCGYQHTFAGLTVTWALAAAGVCALTAGLTAAVADEVPDHQRGLVSGAMFGPQPVGTVLGLLALEGFGAAGRYWGLAIALVVLAVPFLLRYRDVDPAGGAPSLSLRAILEAMWVDPRRHPDFAWAFGSRLLVNVGNALGTTYLYYYLKDGLKVSDPDTLLLEATVVYLVFTLGATFVGGIWSDRIGRRKLFVGIAAASQGVAGVLIVVAPAVPTTFVAAGFLGLGYGAFLAVDQALVTAVLPSAADRAKDLGILSVGTNVPQAVGPLLCAGIVSWLGFGAMFLAAALCSLVGAVMVRQVGVVD